MIKNTENLTAMLYGRDDLRMVSTHYLLSVKPNWF